MHAHNGVVRGGCKEDCPWCRLLQPDHEGSHRAYEKEYKHCCQVLHPDHFVVGGIAEVAPDSLAFSRQLEFFSRCGLPASKTPLQDTIEGSNAHKEEERPACVGSRNGCVLVQSFRRSVHDYASYNRAYYAEYDSRNHTREKGVDETWAFNFSGFGHKCPPWLTIQALNVVSSTTFTASHM